MRTYSLTTKIKTSSTTNVIVGWDFVTNGLTL